jgi:hypothetical protein
MPLPPFPPGPKGQSSATVMIRMLPRCCSYRGGYAPCRLQSAGTIKHGQEARKGGFPIRSHFRTHVRVSEADECRAYR